MRIRHKSVLVANEAIVENTVLNIEQFSAAVLCDTPRDLCARRQYSSRTSTRRN